MPSTGDHGRARTHEPEAHPAPTSGTDRTAPARTSGTDRTAPARTNGTGPTEPARTPLRTILSPGTLARVVIGWGAVGLAMALVPHDPSGLSLGAQLGILAALVTVIVLCALGVVHQAEAIAHRVGDPYGSLVLTLSIVAIEVILIAAVMLGPGDHATIARDSVVAVSMIILHLVVGLCLLVAGLRAPAGAPLAPNRRGAASYLVMLLALGGAGLLLPALAGTDGEIAGPLRWAVVLGSLVLYAGFLARQMGPRSDDYTEAGGEDGPAAPRARDIEESGQAGETTETEEARPTLRAVMADHGRELLLRTLLLLVTVLPIVLLSHHMAALVDTTLSTLGWPTALAGMLIALIVFTPESFTAVRAAARGEIQRVLNLCHGALVSTVGTTVPLVLVIGMLTGQRVVLADTALHLGLIGAALLLSGLVLLIPCRPSRGLLAGAGAVHLLLFVVYVVGLALG